MTKLIVDINNSDDDWVQVTISGPGASKLTEDAILTALSAPTAEDLDLGMERVGKSLGASVKPGINRLADSVAPKAEAVAVKPLEWEELDEVSYRATAIGLRYYVYLNSDDGLWHMYSEGYQPVNGEFTTSEEAKAAAQADYEARILSAIDTSPAPKAEAVIAERDHYKNGLQILADTFYKDDQHHDYAKHVLDTVPIASPVPAITDEAVERAAYVFYNAPVAKGRDDIFADYSDANTCREVARAAILAAFPSKGEGE